MLVIWAGLADMAANVAYAPSVSKPASRQGGGSTVTTEARRDGRRKSPTDFVSMIQSHGGRYGLLSEYIPPTTMQRVLGYGQY
jgi:hypothetical protein